MATRKRHSPEQIVRKLMAADRLLAEGKDTAAVCRELTVSEATYHRLRNQFGGLKAEDAKRLKDLERENATPSGCWPMPSWRRMCCRVVTVVFIACRRRWPRRYP
jgi:putative transposase